MLSCCRRLSQPLIFIVLFLSCDAQNVWPVSGTTTPDLPESSPFGPRLKASEGFRYDFHRGIDIPAPIGTSCYAIADGSVRLVNSPLYSDPMVQLQHTDAVGTSYYSNYLHMNSVSVAEGATVSKGQVVGTSGASVSGFPHLHFEIRYGGVWGYDAVNPWGVLPYDNSTNQLIVNAVDFVFDSVAKTYAVSVNVSQSANQLDLNAVTVELLTASSNAVWSGSINFNEMNKLNNNRTNYVEVLDDPIQGDLDIQPAKFSTADAFANYTFVWKNVVVPETAVSYRATARNVWSAAVVRSLPLPSSVSPSRTPAPTAASPGGAATSTTSGARSLVVFTIMPLVLTLLSFLARS